MDAYIGLEEFAQRIAGYYVAGGALRDAGYVMLLLEEENRRGKTRAVRCKLDVPAEERWRSVQFTGFERITAGPSPREGGMVLVSTGRKVYSIAPGRKPAFEREIPYDRDKGTGCRGGLDRLRVIGQNLYVCGGNRTAGIRRGVDAWQWLTPGIPLSEEERRGYDSGFEDIDGFAENDIYAVGGKNDVWHFNGIVWEKIPLPGKEAESIRAVCCGGDGRVYIAGESTLWCGLPGAWQPVRVKDPTWLIDSMAWYEGQLWCTGRSIEKAVWWLQGDRLVKADLPRPIAYYAGWLDVRDGVLLLAGEAGAAVKRNGEWQNLFYYYAMNQQVKEQGLVEKKPVAVSGGQTRKEQAAAPKPAPDASAGAQVSQEEGDPQLSALLRGPRYSYGPAEKVYSRAIDEFAAVLDAIEEGEKTYEDLAALVLNDPLLPQLKSLVFEYFWYSDDAFPQEFLDCLLANGDRLQHIESLYVGRENEAGYIEQGDYSGLWAALPNLKALVIKGKDGLVLGEVRHENLRHLEIISCEMPGPVMLDLQAAQLPKLETLLLYLDSQQVKTVQGLLQKGLFPALKTLGLMNSEHQGDIAKSVLDSELLPQLRRLYLCYGTGMNDDAGRYIVERAGLLANLQELHLTFHNFSEEVGIQLMLLDVPLVELSLPQEDYEWYSPLYDHETLNNLKAEEIEWLRSDPHSIFGQWR